MGHSDIGVTLNVYTHVQFDDAQTELRRVADPQHLFTNIAEKSLRKHGKI